MHGIVTPPIASSVKLQRPNRLALREAVPTSVPAPAGTSARSIAYDRFLPNK